MAASGDVLLHRFVVDLEVYSCLLERYNPPPVNTILAIGQSVQRALFVKEVARWMC